MIRSLFLAAALGVSSASAFDPGAVTVAAAGGYDDPTRNFYTGIELALRPTNEKGVGVIAGVTPAWGTGVPGVDGDGGVMGFGELGALFHIPAVRAIVRVGFVARASLISVPYRVAVRLGDTEQGEIGLTPAGMLHIEFQYGETSPFTFGVRAGLGSGLSNFRCNDPDDLSGCALWLDSIVASAFGNIRMENGFFADLRFGQISQVSLGYVF